jgi:uncharacterized protein (TIGR02453 family)
MPKQAYFTPELFDFLRKLKRNNNREWFLKNKSRYEQVARDPALRFVSDIGPALRKISSHLRADARPVGGSLFRINRDIRFSADKSPYKTAPGFYLHLEPGTSFAGGGIHMPDTPTLTRIRDAIVKDSAGWKRATAEKSGGPLYQNTHEKLKRAPQGYDPNHPLVEELKRKEFTWHAQYTEAVVCRPDFMDAFLEACRAASPFDRFLAKAVGVPW